VALVVHPEALKVFALVPAVIPEPLTIELTTAFVGCTSGANEDSFPAAPVKLKVTICAYPLKAIPVVNKIESKSFFI
jgi:hypothetical protein